MVTKLKKSHVHHRKSLKWWLRNNFTFFVVIVALCAIVAVIFGYQTYNFERIKSMEAVLDKSYRTIHRGTGLTDHDVSKLKKLYPGFNWENTWDRERFQSGQKDVRDSRSSERSQLSDAQLGNERVKALQRRQPKLPGE